MGGEATLKVGVIGAGVMGGRHARVYSEIDEVELVGVYDPQPERALEVAGLYGGAAFDSLNNLLAAVDAVSIASPTSTHCDAALTALDREVHMLVEKPLAATLAEAQQLVNRSLRCPELVSAVGHIERFNPTGMVLRQVLGDRKITSITTRRTSPFENRSLDTDVIHDLMIHDIDLALDLLGDQVASIDAVGSAIQTEHIDQAIARFTMDDGSDVTMIASRVASRKAREIEVETSDCTIVADLLRKTVSVQPAGADALEAEIYAVPADEPLRVELQHFVDCLAGRARPLVDLYCGYRAMVYAASICALVQRSAVPDMEQQLLAQTGD